MDTEQCRQILDDEDYLRGFLKWVTARLCDHDHDRGELLALDAVVQTWLKHPQINVLPAAPPDEARRILLGYLKAVARNLAKKPNPDTERPGWGQQMRNEEADEDPLEDAADSGEWANPVVVAIRQGENETVRAALSQLGDDDRRILIDFHLRRRGQKAIATDLGCSERHVRRLLAKAEKRLKPGLDGAL